MFKGKDDKGFTLIELMVTVAILAILAAIAVPSYSRYVSKSRVNAAAGDLYALSLALENIYQRTLSYKTSNLPGNNKTKTTEETQTYASTWSPTETIFKYTVAVKTDSTTGQEIYTLTAAGIAGTQVPNCVLSLTNAAGGVTNSRSISVNDTASCSGFSG